MIRDHFLCFAITMWQRFLLHSLTFKILVLVCPSVSFSLNFFSPLTLSVSHPTVYSSLIGNLLTEIPAELFANLISLKTLYGVDVILFNVRLSMGLLIRRDVVIILSLPSITICCSFVCSRQLIRILDSI